MFDKVKPQIQGNKVLTGAHQISFPHLFELHTFPGSDRSEYSCTLLVKKDDRIVPALEKMVQTALAAKFGKKIPANWWNPIQDGDDKADRYPEMAGHYTIKISDRKNQPLVVGPDKMEITDAREIYAGSWVRVKFEVYAYDNIKKGVGFGLRLVQKLADGEPFGNFAPEKVEDLPDLELPDKGDDPFAGFEV